MDSLQKDHERLIKRSKLSKSIDEVQKTIDLLQRARSSIAEDASATPLTLAKLQNPVKTSFDNIHTNLVDLSGGLKNYTKTLDKLFKDKPLPATEYDAMSSHPALVNRAIAMHLLREGQFSVASTFLTEAAAKPSRTDFGPGSPNAYDTLENDVGVDKFQSDDMRKQFANMYHILHELKENRNLVPAIDWARTHSKTLETRGSNLEFDLCRLQFVWLFQGGNEMGQISPINRQRALEYARQELPTFEGRYLKDIQQLMGAMAFCPNLAQSPYHAIFYNISAWDDVAHSFTREFCSLLGLSADSPLYIAATAGAIALPTLLKLQTIMKEKRTEWTTQNELPVEIPLPPSYQFHSIFVCPVSKEQTTDENPPMMMPCGHVIAKESLERLSKGSRFKCPYCPGESHSREAKIVVL